ncbi:MAG: restriction endonuclease subunit R, partial [Candidatus Brocadiia bacterium]
AVIVENDKDVLKWFKPAKGVFQIQYDKRSGEMYEPDFVVETTTTKFLCEPKAANEMTNAEVLAKAKAAKEWCAYATAHAVNHGGKPWTYLLISHDAITANMTLQGLAARWTFGG